MSQKKTGPFIILSIFWQILSDFNIFFSLLQAEINCDQVHHKIYHQTPNLLVHYLVMNKNVLANVAGMIIIIIIISHLLHENKSQVLIIHKWQICRYDFVIKDVTVKQVTLNKINVVSSQAVLEMSSFSMDTRSMSSSPLVSSLVKNRLFKTSPDIDESPFQFIHTMDLSLVYTTLHDSSLLLQTFQETFISFFWRRTPGTLFNHASF